MISDIVWAVIYLVGVAGIVLAGWGTYHEIRGSNSGLIRIIIGTVMLGFAGIAVPIAGKLLHI